jgi:hypothetical protein
MGYYVVIDGEYTQPLASLGGWADFKRFVATFDEADFGNIKHLIQFGWDQDLQPMLEELREMLRHKPPKSVASTIRDLINTIESGPENPDVIVLTDGAVEDDGADDEDFEDDWEGGDPEGDDPENVAEAAELKPLKAAGRKPAQKASRKKR